MKRRILLVGMVVVLVLVAVGCGGGNRLSGTWEAGREGSRETFEFSGNRFTHTTPGQRWATGQIITHGSTRSGTFSISDDQIELNYEGGNIAVHSFSRTENTITIGGRRFNRAS